MFSDHLKSQQIGAHTFSGIHLSAVSDHADAPGGL
jgi:hypothetical protein